jgi:hypothetical protein
MVNVAPFPKELDMAKTKDRRKEKKKPKQPKQPKTK